MLHIFKIFSILAYIMETIKNHFLSVERNFVNQSKSLKDFRKSVFYLHNLFWAIGYYTELYSTLTDIICSNGDNLKFLIKTRFSLEPKEEYDSSKSKNIENSNDIHFLNSYCSDSCKKTNNKSTYFHLCYWMGVNQRENGCPFHVHLLCSP